jgi:DNA polymerase-3 subunit delta'
LHSYIITNQNQYLETIQKLLNITQILTITNNPDITLIKTETSTIKIDQIRQLKIQNQRPPIQNPHNILIIENAHLMTTPAQNALLKLLEEPSPHTKIFLITPQPNSLLPTILSRCQIIKHVLLFKGETPSASPAEGFNSPTQSQVSSLKSQISTLISQISDSSLTKRLTLIEPHTKDRQTAIELVEQLIHTCQKNMKVLPLKGETPSASPAEGFNNRTIYLSNFQAVYPSDFLRQKSRKFVGPKNWSGEQSNNNSPVSHLSSLVSNLLTAHQDLQTNLNVKLTMDNLVLNWDRGK